MRDNTPKREFTRGSLQVLYLKYEVLSAYSQGRPRCSCCGEDKVEFLTLDHIDGGGSKHRARILKSGSSFYSWLKKNGWPRGFQVLCYNCNSAKHQRGECPHQSGLFLTKDQMERPPPKKKVGSANHQSKLSERKVMRILAELKAGLKQRDIASRYGISTYTVSLIKKGEAWAHVKRS